VPRLSQSQHAGRHFAAPLAPIEIPSPTLSLPSAIDRLAHVVTRAPLKAALAVFPTLAVLAQ
jgi:hypothetical protein